MSDIPTPKRLVAMGITHEQYQRIHIAAKEIFSCWRDRGGPSIRKIESWLGRIEVMTPEEKEKARRNWVYGNIVLSNPDVTREMVDEVADEMYEGYRDEQD